MADRHALVAGASGLVGRRIAARLLESGWRVAGLCRRPPADSLPYSVISVDLTDADDCRAKLAGSSAATHVFYAARYDHPEGTRESIDVNAAMLENLIGAVEPIAAGLRHVHLVHGTKYYGHTFGPLPALPLTENSRRASVPNFYFAHEDFIRARQKGKVWTYTTSRPHTFCDANTHEPRNAALLIAVLASLARATKTPFFYPGSERSFHVRTQFTSVPMLARAIEWIAITPACANQSYNVVNGDALYWSQLWSTFAEYFDVEPGGPASGGLADYLVDKAAVWQDLVDRNQLESVPLASRVLWPYADYLFAPEWDIVSSASKVHRDGFQETVDSTRMFIELFDAFRREKIIP